MPGGNIVKYTLTPGLTTEDPADYSTTSKLTDNIYDVKPHNLKMFLQGLSSRVMVSGWKTSTNINGEDVITQYGRIPIEDCHNEAKANAISITRFCCGTSAKQ